MSGVVPGDEVITLTDMIRCAERELAMRRNVYPRWIEKGRMKESTANHELAAMERIIETLTALREVRAGINQAVAALVKAGI